MWICFSSFRWVFPIITTTTASFLFQISSAKGSTPSPAPISFIRHVKPKPLQFLSPFLLFSANRTSSENHSANKAKALFSTKLQFISMSLKIKWLIFQKNMIYWFLTTIVCNFVLASTSTCRTTEAKANGFHREKKCPDSSSSGEMVNQLRLRSHRCRAWCTHFA